ncbi:MAG: VWA domain-containing protein [Pyrinomonadaceae bacterium]|nr:VWA domain-containing protein [Pyrinomonadaceae bacterium]
MQLALNVSRTTLLDASLTASGRHRQDSEDMIYPCCCVAQSPARVPLLHPNFFRALCAVLLLLAACAVTARAQNLERELNAPEKVSVHIKNRNGRVVVIASEEQQKKVSLKAVSQGAPVAETDVVSVASGGEVKIDVRARREQDRIDITVRVPARAKVKVTTGAGAVDVIGNVASAEIETDTGTIHADVPLDAVRFNFVWQASRPRYLSDPELPQVKEKAGGWYVIKGKLGDQKAKKDARIQLEFTTQRGVVLFNVDPNMVPPDLRERPLTEAARAIVRSGNSNLIDSIRLVSPKLFGDYAKTLPPPREAPSLTERRAPENVAVQVAPGLMSVNAHVTDRNGRAISGLKASDFRIIENGTEREVTEVTPTSAPFNLVLLLDVSGSVVERIDFIRKAARNFLSTASAQDRIAIISFRDDIQVISNFTTDRRLLSERLDLIDAGGSTAVYDALAYVLVETLKPLRGERTAIVMMSDGDDNRSFVPFDALVDEILESGALVYPLYIPSGLIPEASAPKPSVTRDPLRTRYLTLTSRAEAEGQRLATISGGVYYPIKYLEDLQRAYDDVVAQLRMSYTITYASSLADTGERRVRARVKREGLAVRLSLPTGTTSSREKP